MNLLECEKVHHFIALEYFEYLIFLNEKYIQETIMSLTLDIAINGVSNIINRSHSLHIFEYSLN